MMVSIIKQSPHILWNCVPTSATARVYNVHVVESGIVESHKERFILLFLVLFNNNDILERYFT